MSGLEEREIREYVLSQGAPDCGEEVTLVQKVGRRRVMSRDYDLYDVHMLPEGRFWVITNPTNCYSQSDFQGVDQAFVYHVGLGYVLHEQFKVEPDEHHIERVSRPWRRFARACEAMNEATEAEDYQAVGMRCREALIALAREHASADWVVLPEELPQASNVKEWLRIYAESLTVDRPRSYIKGLSERTWDLTNWLQHYSSATEWDAQMVLDATGHLLNTFALLLVRKMHESPSQCPECDSRQVREDSSELIERDGHFGNEEWLVCATCGWESDHEYVQWEPERLQRLMDYHSGDWSPPRRSMEDLEPPSELDGDENDHTTG